MFSNIGGKIKIVAQVACYVGIAMSILVCLVNIATAIERNDGGFAIFWLVGLILFPVFSWASTLLLYGIGQFVENSDMLIDLITDVKVGNEDSED